jgi:hypothetical protein
MIMRLPARARGGAAADRRTTSSRSAARRKMSYHPSTTSSGTAIFAASRSKLMPFQYGSRRLGCASQSR